MKILAKALKMDCKETTKNIKKYNRNIIVFKNAKCYNIYEYRVVYACAIFTISDMLKEF